MGGYGGRKSILNDGVHLMIKDYSVLREMIIHGGAFVKSLAECASKADLVNYRKLRKAFPDYFESYAKFAGVELIDLDVHMRVFPGPTK